MTEPAKQVDQPISVLIIGFGISSISATHTFISNGFKKVTVIEASKELGGVWNSAHNHHPTLVANNTRHTFEFPELRHNPDLYNDFPTQEQVNSYLQQYVEDFDLEKYVHYDTKVQKLSRRKKSEDHNWVFDVVFSKPVNGSTHSSFEFVVISTGSNHKPHIPIGLSSDLAPKGVMTLHSSKVRYQLAKDSHLFQDKNVVVVGASKSGQDISVLAAELGATQVTLVGGMTHWFPPRYFGGDDSSTGQFNEEVLYNRVSSAMLPGNPEALIYNGSIVPKALYFFQSWRVGKMLRNAFWTKTQSDIATQFQIPRHLLPEKSVVEDSRHLAIQNPNFFPVEKAGKIKVVLGHATSYNDVNIALTVKTRTDETRDIGGVDIVILATGFDLSLDFLSNEIKSRLFNEFGQLQLFRNLYNPELPQMGFLGFHLNANQMLTPAIASRWLVELAKGKDGALYKRGVLDDKTTMYKSINAGVCWERQFYKDPTLANGIYTTGFGVHPYLDCIMTELGSKRFLDQGSRGFVASFTEPLLPAQFKGFINAPLET